jgi:hypothetical protein
MDYYNADGLPADLCLNGTAVLPNWPSTWAGRRTGRGCSRSGSRPRSTSREDRVALEIPTESIEPQPIEVPVEGGPTPGSGSRSGAPLRPPWPGSLAEAPVYELGREIRKHPLRAGGDERQLRAAPGAAPPPPHRAGRRGRDPSCGSGIMASVAAGIASGALELPVEVETQGVPPCRWRPGREAWSLTGDARVVARGAPAGGGDRATSPPGSPRRERRTSSPASAPASPPSSRPTTKRPPSPRCWPSSSALPRSAKPWWRPDARPDRTVEIALLVRGPSTCGRTRARGWPWRWGWPIPRRRSFSSTATS